MAAQTDVPFEKLSVSEQILYVQDLWDEIVAREPEFELTEFQRKELDRRLLALESDPGRGVTWEDAVGIIKSRRQNSGT